MAKMGQDLRLRAALHAQRTARMRARTGALLRAAYAAGVLGLMAAVAWWRADLTAEFLETAARLWARGGAARARIAAEAALLLAILAGTVHWLSRGPSPRRDARLALTAAALGAAAEAWGTRTGLWTYYTAEAPPLWIVPAWALGAVIVDRVHAGLRISSMARRTGALPRAAARLLHILLGTAALAVCVLFARPAWGRPATWAILAGLAAAAFWRAEPRDAVRRLAVGAGLVVFADLWGTLSECWRYHLQRPGSPWGQAGGVAFGACFDSLVVLAAMRLTGDGPGRFGSPAGRRSPRPAP